MKYTAASKTLDQLIQEYLSKGLRIYNIDEAKNTLLSIGFFRFNRYSHSFQISGGSGSYSFIEGTEFDDIVEVYQFDSTLRKLIFESIIDIEVAFKSVMNYIMCTNFGTHWYLNGEVYKKEFIEKLDAENNSGFDKFILKMTDECVNSKEQYITKYRNNFKDPALPPSWMIMEIIPFGTASTLYQNIGDTTIRTEIASKFKTLQNIFETWLVSLSYIRNQCAHHHKLIDRFFMFPPIIPKREKHRFLNDCELIDQTTLYAILCVIQHILNSLGLNITFKSRLLEVVNNISSFDIKNLGFTENWEIEPIWK